MHGPATFCGTRADDDNTDEVSVLALSIQSIRQSVGLSNTCCSHCHYRRRLACGQVLNGIHRKVCPGWQMFLNPRLLVNVFGWHRCSITIQCPLAVCSGLPAPPSPRVRKME